MDSSSDSSFFNRSNTQETEDSTPSHRTRKGKANELWSLHAPLGDPVKGQDPTQHYCLYCEPPASYSSNTTTNIQRHLAKSHNTKLQPTIN